MRAFIVSCRASSSDFLGMRSTGTRHGGVTGPVVGRSFAGGNRLPVVGNLVSIERCLECRGRSLVNVNDASSFFGDASNPVTTSSRLSSSTLAVSVAFREAALASS